MNSINRVLAALAIFAVVNLIVTELFVVQVISSIALCAICAYWLFRFEELQRRRNVLSSELEAIKKTCEELDKNTKRIIATDLELEKTQEELDKKIAGLYALQDLSNTVKMTTDADEVFKQINDELLSRFGFEKALVCLEGNKPGAKLELKAAVGYADEQIKDILKCLENEELILNIPREGKTILMGLPSEVSPSDERLCELLDVEVCITAPIIIEGKQAGFLCVGNEPQEGKTATEGDRELIVLLSNQLSGVLENSRLYAEVWRSHKDLENRVSERTRELAEANKQLKRLNELKSDFVSAVSHELRTPLTSIKGYASILIGGKLGEVNPAVKERLEKVNKHSDSLVALVNNLLDISRIESGRVEMKMEEVRLEDLIKGVLDLISPQIKEKSLKINLNITSGLKTIWVDVHQIERVFTNLLSNAYKFTPADGNITITCQMDNGTAKISVSDTGQGIPKDEIPKLFTEFFRASNAAEQKGTGLGLSLVRRIIQAHGGDITVSSELGRGTTFAFTLPLAPHKTEKGK